jgi:hypothetical protein
MGGCVLNYVGSYFYDWYRDWIKLMNKETHRAFLANRYKKSIRVRLEPNALSILTRAINRPKLRAPIRQPCWRAGRWKSRT